MNFHETGFSVLKSMCPCFLGGGNCPKRRDIGCGLALFCFIFTRKSQNFIELSAAENSF